MPFKFTQSKLNGVLHIEPQKFGDNRGFFMENYKRSEYMSAGISDTFIQDNHSCSSQGTLRGVHFQREPKAQSKLIRVTRGAVWDVVVDLRRGSSTFGQWDAVELSEENNRMIYVPTGFGHGFLTLKDDTHFLYKCSDEYSPECDAGILWCDSQIGIEWPKMEYIISEKDKNLPLLGQAKL